MVKNKKAQFVMTRKLLFLQYQHTVRRLGQGGVYVLSKSQEELLLTVGKGAQLGGTRL